MFRSELTAAIQAAHTPETMSSGRATDARPTPRRPPHRTVVRLWLPLTTLWLILSPFAVLAAPLLLLAPRTGVRRPFSAVFALGRTLLALSGTVVDVDTPDALVRIRIF
jgi:hypothetical protein